MADTADNRRPAWRAKCKWNQFSVPDQFQCAENNYRCLIWGLYTYDGRYRCGCNRTDIGDFSWAEREAIE